MATLSNHYSGFSLLVFRPRNSSWLWCLLSAEGGAHSDLDAKMLLIILDPLHQNHMRPHQRVPKSNKSKEFLPKSNIQDFLGSLLIARAISTLIVPFTVTLLRAPVVAPQLDPRNLKASHLRQEGSPWSPRMNDPGWHYHPNMSCLFSTGFETSVHLMCHSQTRPVWDCHNIGSCVSLCSCPVLPRHEPAMWI